MMVMMMMMMMMIAFVKYVIQRTVQTDISFKPWFHLKIHFKGILKYFSVLF